jgi:tripartite-type tricarboxylate transporter receptor subunit TctC
MDIRTIALVLLSALTIASAAAQERPDTFPSRSIKIVVPFPAGGPSDVLTRLIGQRMSEDWGQPVVIENRVGANTVLGAQQVAKAAPDGYTLLMAIDSTLSMNQYLYRTPPYDPFVDFARRRQHRDRGGARRQDAGRRLHPVRGDGCHHGAQSDHQQEPAL